MEFAGINYISVLAAAIAGFAFGAVWYMTLAKPWMAAVGMTEEPKQDPVIYGITFLCQLVMAYMMAGVMGHLGQISVSGGLVTALFVWLGFILTTQVVNHRFQMQKWSLTLIDCGHWLGVLMVMGIVIGLFGG